MVTTGKSIRIYLADGNVTGIRHGEIVNWTGQAIACPRTRFPELKEWSETKRPGVYFLLGQNEESGQEAVYIGEAEIVLDRLLAHISGVSGKEFWTEVVIFTSKDENLTKGHVRYLEARLVQLATAASRFLMKNTAQPQLPALPRPDRDAMEEFIIGTRTLLGVLGHRVLEPLVSRHLELQPLAMDGLPEPKSATSDRSVSTFRPLTLPQTFELHMSGVNASAVRTDEGLVILANSEATKLVHESLSAGYRALRERLLSSGVLVDNGAKLKFARDQLFRNPSPAAAIVVGYSVNGRDKWKTLGGVTLSNFEKSLARNMEANSDTPNVV
jgi:hypothetical protein